MIRTVNVLVRAAALGAAVVAFASTPAAAQTPVTAPPPSESRQTVLLGTPAFARLVEDKRVRVTMSDGTVRQGVVAAVSQTGMTIEDKAGTPVPFDRVVKVEEAPRRARRGALIGLVSGVAQGTLFFLICRAIDGPSECGFYVPLWAGLGTGTGLLVAGIVRLASRHEDVLYDATPRTTTSVAFMPILSPTRKGLAVSIGWR